MRITGYDRVLRFRLNDAKDIKGTHIVTLPHSNGIEERCKPSKNATGLSVC
jgi:hypothetical protein